MSINVKQAVWLIWAMIGLTAILALVDRWMGKLGIEYFGIYLFLLAIYSIIPYKISQGSNGARYIFLIIFVINILLFLADGKGDMSIVSFVGFIVQIPISIYVATKLFNKEEKMWFEKEIND
jgi:uncharacterized membrane protein